MRRANGRYEQETRNERGAREKRKRQERKDEGKMRTKVIAERWQKSQ